MGQSYFSFADVTGLINRLKNSQYIFFLLIKQYVIYMDNKALKQIFVKCLQLFVRNTCKIAQLLPKLTFSFLFDFLLFKDKFNCCQD